MKNCMVVLIFLSILTIIMTGCEKKEPIGKSEKELVIVSFGGSFQESQRKAFFEPFIQETGIKIREMNYDGSYELIKGQVNSGSVAWDVVDVESSTLARGSVDGLFEEIPEEITNGINFVEGCRTPFGVGANVYATLLAYREDIEKVPSSWSDFFNVDAFPGPRSLRRNPRGTLEIALLADGVNPSSLYPLDITRALKSLDRIKNSISVWWTSGQQPIDLLDKRTVKMSSAWSGRVWSARRDGKKIIPIFDNALFEVEYWVIPKGSHNKDLALKFIKSALIPERQAKMAELFGVGPTNKASMQKIPTETAKMLITSEEYIKKSVLFNPTYWQEHEVEIQKEWEEWISR